MGQAREQVRRAEELKRLQQEEMEDLEGTAGGLEGAQTLVQALQTEDGEGVLQEGASETEDSDLEEEEGSGDIDTDMEASDGGGLRVGLGASLEQKFEDEDEAMEPPKPKPTGPKRTSLFQTRFPMFPAETEQINLTDYGEVLGPDLWRLSLVPLQRNVCFVPRKLMKPCLRTRTLARSVYKH